MSERFDKAIRAFDEANSKDPHTTLVDAVARPAELVDAERLSAWVARLDPIAAEPLRLAARCQHIRRWEIPRSRYPDGRAGYLEWRKALARFHADVAGKILADSGYGPETTERVRAINLKRALKLDRDVQTMEDALCLTFLEFEALEFAAKHPEAKVVEILRKTWHKMSERGRGEASKLSLPGSLRRLLAQAVEEQH